MIDTFNDQINHEIEDTITFMVKRFNQSNHNFKPVILHSIRTTMLLYEFGYDEVLIKSALLHDLIEDSDTKIEEITEKFGNQVSDIVMANTFNDNIKDKIDRYKENFDRCLKLGSEALIVKTADIIANISFVKPENKQILEKHKYFLDISKPIIGKELIWKRLFQEWKEKYE